MSGRIRAIAPCERGQAAVEVVGLLPLVAAVGLAATTATAAHAAAEQAGAAAEAGAVALLQDRPARAAARAALPEGARATVRVDGRTIRVAVAPRTLVPGLGRILEATAEADAGPEAGS